MMNSSDNNSNVHT